MVDEIEPHPEDVADQEMNEAAVRDGDDPGPAAPPLTPEAMVHGVLQRLESNVTPHALTGHTFSVAAILSFLKFAYNLKPSATIQESLGDAAEIFFGHEAGSALRTGLALSHCPSLDYMRQSRLRLDLMNILYERQLFLRFDIARYLLVDSSPQGGTTGK